MKYSLRDKIFRSARNWGWLLAIAVSIILYIMAIGANSAGVPLPGLNGDTKVTTNVVPLNPGTSTALEVCQKATTLAKLPLMVEPPPPKDSYRYIAQFGASTLNWPDDQINRVADLDGTSIVLDQETISCLRKAKSL